MPSPPRRARQAAQTSRLADELREARRWAPAPPVVQLPDHVALDDLPVEVAGQPALGLADDTLAPVGFALDDPLLVCGPPQAERPRFLHAMLESVRRTRGDAVKVAVFAPRASRLAPLAPWAAAVVVGDEPVAEAAREITAALRNGTSIDGIVIENVSDFPSGADNALQELVRACVAAGAFVIAEADSNVVTSSYGVAQLVRSSRHGVALQPDQAEGDNIFRTAFPRSSRADFPVGRGFYVRHGRVTKVQCAAQQAAAVG